MHCIALEGSTGSSVVADTSLRMLPVVTPSRGSCLRNSSTRHTCSVEQLRLDGSLNQVGSTGRP